MSSRSEFAVGPIAIVGMAFRLPGGNTTIERFAEFLGAGRSGIEDIPADRWNVAELYDPSGAPGKIRARRGGFLDQIDRFDAAFFSISPKEARYVDPQQRLVLEVAWEALESANVNPSAASSRNGGVYIGCSTIDYSIQIGGLSPAELDAYLGPGTAMSAVSGRLSYSLGWRGPSMSVDTACSSSLVAIHLACQGLRQRECDIAVSGGVNAIHSPRNHLIFTQANMLSPDGRCKTFDDAADGYGRSEGCGIIVLKRLADAQRDGDTILALIRGSSVRQDGASGGLTVPNGLAQAEVMRDAVRRAGLASKDIHYVEAHGTGTPLGDPIEMGAINAAFGNERANDGPVVVASVKANIGHMEAAAGIGGVIKTVLQLREGFIYPHTGMQTPSRHIPWDRYAVAVPTVRREWPAAPRHAVVNSFGFAGTIASVVVSDAPPRSRPAPEPARNEGARPVHLFTASAKSESALRRLLEIYGKHPSMNPDVELADFCYSTNVGRAHFDFRFGAAVESRAELRAVLGAEVASGSRSKTSELPVSKAAFLFTGQGSQYAGMGRTLYRDHAVIRKWIDILDVLFEPALGLSVKGLLVAETGADAFDINETWLAQPALFALEYALAQLWISWGIQPSILLGHSIGEIAAAAVAGLFTLEDAVKLVAARGKLMQSVTAPGAMAAVRASAKDIVPYLAEHADLGFAAFNADEQCVISGGRASLNAVVAKLRANGLVVKPLAVSHAFHSALMADAASAFGDVIREVEFRAPELTFVSNVTGRVAKYDDVANPAYWARHILEPVDFAGGIRSVLARGAHVFIEIGPSAALVALGKQAAGTSGDVWLASMVGPEEDGNTIRRSVLRCYRAGLPISWSDFHSDQAYRRVSLPAYPFERKRFWLPLAGTGQGRVSSNALLQHHPLLGAETSSAEQRGAGTREFVTQLNSRRPNYLADHVVMGKTVFPGAGFVELLFALQDAALGTTSRLLEDVHIHEPLFLDDNDIEVCTRIHHIEGERPRVDVVSRVATGDGTIERLHLTAFIGEDTRRASGLEEMTKPLQARASNDDGSAVIRAGDDLYAEFVELGLAYGPEFQRLRQVAAHADGIAIGDLGNVDTGPVEHVPPYLLDGAMQTLLCVAEPGKTYLPVGFDRIELVRKGKGPLRSAVRLRPADPKGARSADIVLCQGEKTVLAVEGLRLVRVANHAADACGIFHETRWLKRLPPVAKAAPEGERHVVLIHPPSLDLQNARSLKCTVVADEAEASRMLRTKSDITDLCWFWRAARELSGVTRIRTECERNYRELIALAKGLEQSGRSKAPRVWLITRGGAWLPGDNTEARDVESLAAGSAWGFGRVLLNEYPSCRATLIDLPPQASPADGRILLEELLAANLVSDEFEIAYRGGMRHVRRLSRVVAAEGEGNAELAFGDRGQLSDARLAAAPDPSPVGNEIRVQVQAAGVNFKDVLNALGMLRQYALDNGLEDKALPLGFECAGRVIEAGPEATFEPGDEVIVTSRRGCMKRRLTVSSEDALLKPKSLSFEDAAALPAAFVTAYHALCDLARIKAGDRVLIHAAAGGVGQAAVRLAKLAGAEIFATASPAKWDMLRAQGIDHTMSSRTLDFSDEILRRTSGRGVDIVLNSLNGDYVAGSARCLAKGGRFVELGKIGIWSSSRMRKERPDVAYFNFDLSEASDVEFRHLNRRVLDAVMGYLARGDMAKLPTTVYPVDEAAEAFNVLSRGASIGKIVLRLGDEHPDVEQPVEIRADETYLITGGLGALGVLAAQKLAARGARHIALVSRRDVPPDELAKLAADFDPAVQLNVVRGDVSRAEDVQRIINGITNSGVPLGGVIHAAGVLADAPLAKQTWESFATVFAPKVYGGLLLHQAVESLPTVRFFVAYSSITAVLGTAGQGNYAAANAYIDLLMQWRSAARRPALSINWGPWGEVGMAARLDGPQLRSLDDRGFKLLQPARGMRALFKAMSGRRSHVIVSGLDWDRYAATSALPNAVFDQVAKVRATAAPAIDLDELRSMSKDESIRVVTDLVRAKVAQALYFESPDEVPVGAKLVELGLDSLVVVGLKNSIEAALSVPLSTSVLFDYPTIRALGEYLARQVTANGDEVPAAIDEVDVRDLSVDEARNQIELLSGSLEQ
jgi:myxalamid-type polyketide synthase MxaB